MTVIQTPLGALTVNAQPWLAALMVCPVKTS
jgi:hypothetical protein